MKSFAYQDLLDLLNQKQGSWKVEDSKMHLEALNNMINNLRPSIQSRFGWFISKRPNSTGKQSIGQGNYAHITMRDPSDLTSDRYAVLTTCLSNIRGTYYIDIPISIRGWSQGDLLIAGSGDFWVAINMKKVYDKFQTTKSAKFSKNLDIIVDDVHSLKEFLPYTFRSKKNNIVFSLEDLYDGDYIEGFARCDGNKYEGINQYGSYGTYKCTYKSKAGKVYDTTKIPHPNFNIQRLIGCLPKCRTIFYALEMYDDPIQNYKIFYADTKSLYNAITKQKFTNISYEGFAKNVREDSERAKQGTISQRPNIYSLDPSVHWVALNSNIDEVDLFAYLEKCRNYVYPKPVQKVPKIKTPKINKKSAPVAQHINQLIQETEELSLLFKENICIIEDQEENINKFEREQETYIFSLNNKPSCQQKSVEPMLILVKENKIGCDSS